uniref:DNA-directed RNA polymerase subunit alpha n=1 Tax=Coscinodiscus radiatus TaxID=33642 RepID=A0A023HA96_9STRA|nr:RNA polymerase a-subunit [Coscinodiscus radiatus]AGH28515.1 RNA polymerase a-subunit [Coscinodiscus radiatus]
MDYPYINCLKSEKFDSGILYGQFLINSLGPGQGISIGNILRRVLLGDLGGTCITAIRIAGIRDEFSVIVGVREDILEILLNLKGVILKSKTLDSQVGRIKVQGPAIITADLIQLPEDLKIINPNHYIATISSNNTVEIELKFDHGTGYKLAGKSFPEKSEDFIELDAIFMPIKKVDFKVETIYDNSKNVSERLVIEIWTNGSITPEEAIFKASHSIIGLFNTLVNNQLNSDIKKSQEKDSAVSIDPYSNIAIEELQLSVRAYNCLKRAQIHTIGDLLEYSPEKLQQLKNFGRKSADEVFITLKTKLGIILK